MCIMFNTHQALQWVYGEIKPLEQGKQTTQEENRHQLQGLQIFLLRLQHPWNTTHNLFMFLAQTVQATVNLTFWPQLCTSGLWLLSYLSQIMVHLNEEGKLRPSVQGSILEQLISSSQTPCWLHGSLSLAGSWRHLVIVLLDGRQSTEVIFS